MTLLIPKRDQSNYKQKQRELFFPQQIRKRYLKQKQQIQDVPNVIKYLQTKIRIQINAISTKNPSLN